MNVNKWVEYIQTLHPREIELTLERVRKVYMRLYPDGMRCKVISVSGTNGKGSTAELCASIYRQAGYQVGKFTSPHLVYFNERVNINGAAVGDKDLLSSFVRIEAARGDIPITFFEYGTLLAIDLFEHANVDIAIMEVGLGGRLDSVNILDADVSITTSVAIDHTAWLGDTIEKIAYEKAGIARPNKPYIVGMGAPPPSLIEHAKKINTDLQIVTQDFNYYLDGSLWSCKTSDGVEYKKLPLPFAQTGVQLSNCALAIQAISQLQLSLTVSEENVIAGVAAANLPGRCQIVQREPLIVFDVSHNEASTLRLSEFLALQFSPKEGAKCVAVCGMLKDKEIAASLAQVVEQVDCWHTASIDNERGASSLEVAKQLENLNALEVNCYDSARLAYEAAKATLTEHDCLVVFGSFHIVGDILNKDA